MRDRLLAGALLLLALPLYGCTTHSATPPVPPVIPVEPERIDGKHDASAKHLYQQALDTFAEHDRRSDWNEDACATLARAFLDASEANKASHGKLPEAVYNAGLAHQRCNNDAEAKKHFGQALALDPKSHRAKTQLALYAYKEGGDGALESTIHSLEQAVLDAEFQNTEALVNLAMLQMKRGGEQSGTGCQGDLDCAKKNIQRALAVDDGFMPAFNQLAIYYLERAKKAAGSKKTALVAGVQRDKKIDAQQLELAALVCSQAVRKNPKYAPIHNTAGLIQVELGNINSAVQSFKTASDLDPGFFEAQMNYAAVNLSFRGFKNAEDAYRAALKIRPQDYDAHLGLALAIRGQLSDANLEDGIKAAQEALDKAKKIAPERPETYYNEGILTQEFKVKATTDLAAQLPILEQARSLYGEFIRLAGSSPEYAGAVKHAQERMEDIEATRKFLPGSDNP